VFGVCVCKRSPLIILRTRLSLCRYRVSLCPFSLQLMAAMDRVCGGSGQGRVVSLLEGGYDTQPLTLGLATCVEAHVKALRDGGI
jgi:hypothetical protein